MAAQPSRLGDTLFALFHLALLAGAAGAAVLSLLKGNTWRFLLITCCLGIYYFMVLDKPVRKERARRKSLRGNPPEKSPKP
jgi:hypothetical protein